MINLDGRSVMIIGGTGTFGRAMVEHLLENNPPARLVVFSRGEHAQARMQHELREADEFLGGRLRFFIGDVRDKDRLAMAMRNIEVVIHAAALKSIGACEYNPQEAISTNVRGTQNVIEAAISSGCRKVMLISTDKAVAPTTLYGATKLVAERLFAAGSALGSSWGPTFSVVRYGNVWGSAGSVGPFFRAEIEKQKAELRDPVVLPLTHLDTTRFFWRIEEAVRFTLRAMEEAEPGEIWIPKLLAAQMRDIIDALGARHRIVGLRPGEKIHETLLELDEMRQTGELEDAFVISPPGCNPRPDPVRFDSTPYCSGDKLHWMSRHDIGRLLYGKSA